MTNQRVVHTRVPAIVILLFALAALLPDAFSQEELTPPGSPATAEADAGGGMPPANEVDRDFLFASGLIEIGFPDFADKVVQKVLLTRPELKDRAKLIQAEIMIKRRKFTDAEALVKEMGAANPKAQAISLALANGYYQMGETEKAKGLYNEFFRVYEGRAPTDPDLLRFYQDAAYRFGQMLEAAGDYEGAIKAYGRILTTKVDRDAQRRIQSDQAAMYMRLAAKAPGDQRERYLGEAKKLCETIQWGGMDIWFGQSIITMANISLLRGDKTGATKVLQSNMDILKEIDKFMQEAGMPMSISPMAGARFLLGDLLQQQADAIAGSKEKTEEAIQTYARALTEFYNVFAKYGDSDWGPEAGVRAQAIKSKLEREYGKKINIDLGAFQAKAAATQFKLGDNLFRQRQYQAAIDEYLKNLNQFPEGDISAAALANLLQCYANLNDTLSVKMVTEYLGERFSQNPQAALALLALGKYYFDTNDVPMYTYAYESYLHYFPKHEKAGLILFTLAGLSKKSGDEAAAMDYYRRIVENYKQDQYYLKALSQMGWSLYAAKDYAGAIKGFQVYLAEAQPSQLKAQAQFSLADCYLQTGDFKNALEAFKTLVGWLSVSNNPYAVNTAEVQKNDELAEKSLFQLGFCLARLADPKDAIPAYRASAIKVFDSFIAKYPQSPLAAKAYSYKGTVQLELNQADAAAKTFDELAAKYPQTEEGKSALYALVRSALEIKQLDQARSAFQKMLADPGKYTPDDFSRIGQMMLDAGLNQQAIEAFQKVVNSSQERTLLERALFGLGSASYNLKSYDDAIKYLSELMEKYPKSGLFYDAKFMLAEAYRDTGRGKQAIDTLSDISKYADTPLMINKASYELGMTQKTTGDQQGALASFVRVGFLGDATKPEIRPYVEKSLLESISLAMELGRYQDVEDSCDQFMKTFPQSDKLETVRRAKADAKVKAAQAANVLPAPAPAGQPRAK